MALKILFLSHRFFPDLGGIETVSEILANNFSKAGHEVRLMTWSKMNGKKDFPFKVIRNPGLLTLFRQHAWADVTYENNPCLRLMWPALLFRRPSVISLHTWIAVNGIQSRLKYRLLKRAKKVIACSNVIASNCWPSCTVIGNPYQETIFKTDCSIPRQSDFIFVGRLVSDKGAHIAIQAFSILMSRTRQSEHSTRNLSLTIVGDGPERRHLENMTNELHLDKIIKFRGALYGDALVSCLNSHRYLLVPSVWEEPFGLVVLEGMACGCLPIVSDRGGLPDAAGRAGIAVPSNDPSALAGAMERIMLDPLLESRLRAAIPEQLLAHDSQTVSRRYLSIIEDVMSGN